MLWMALASSAIAAGPPVPTSNPNPSYGKVNINMTYHSRPDLQPPKIVFSVYDTDKVTPGYILWAPYTPPLQGNLNSGSATGSLSSPGALEFYEASTIQNGPYIYDHKGNLVFSGYGIEGGENTHDVKLTEYEGEPAISYGQIIDVSSGSRGHGVIMGKNYQTIATVYAGNGRTSNDIHEFTVLPDRTALTTIFMPTQYDLSAYGVTNQSVAWIVQPIFQNIDIKTGNVLFEWASLDHVSPSESYNTIDTPTAGDGLSVSTAWDFFHMNSIEKDAAGNYLISSRFLSALIYIDGKDGHIIWRMGGKKSDFTFQGFNNTNAPFAFQHHARIHSQNATQWTISLFDNANDGASVPEIDGSETLGLMFTVDLPTKVVTLQHNYSIGVLSSSQGSMDVLPNGHVFMGFGSEPYIAEFLPDGTQVMVGQFGASPNLAENYRAFKIAADSWHGFPDSTPALWMFANSTSEPTAFYVSWNGATEVATWKFYGGAMDGNGRHAASVEVGTATRDGFETTFIAKEFYAMGYAEALDKDGKCLGKSPLKSTFYPGNNGTGWY
ncbi:MAG: hypothetical protein M1821_007275 [Bathelium mastoideum]|nr:MAG: hypothetical protein M1821_007275 [Bathelium mastoideum]